MSHVLILVAATIGQVSEPAPVTISTDPLILHDNFAPGLPADCAQSADPECATTLTGIYYPPGVGPAGQGCARDPRPVLIALRGADTNPPLPKDHAWFADGVLDRGFIGIDPNFAEVCGLPDDIQHGDPIPADCLTDDKDYMTSVASVARLVQHLRANSGWYNIDPDRIFVFGRSFGGVIALALGLRDDFQNVAAVDPIEHFSSRPNYIIPFSAPAALTCAPAFSTFNGLMELFFPVGSLPTATLQQKLDDSAWWWINNYVRDFTPPMFMGYNLGYTLGCGQVQDPHDGVTGLVLNNAFDDYISQTHNASLGLSTVLHDTPDFYAFSPITVDIIMDWAVAQIDGQAESIYLLPENGPVAPVSTTTTFEIVGGTPGSQAFFFLGFTEGTIPIPWCPSISGGLLDFFVLGVVPVDSNGRAALDVFIPAGTEGLSFKLQVLDLFQCQSSNLITMYIS